jgi:hypothetical protein
MHCDRLQDVAFNFARTSVFRPLANRSSVFLTTGTNVSLFANPKPPCDAHDRMLQECRTTSGVTPYHYPHHSPSPNRKTASHAGILAPERVPHYSQHVGQIGVPKRGGAGRGPGPGHDRAQGGGRTDRILSRRIASELALRGSIDDTVL